MVCIVQREGSFCAERWLLLSTEELLVLNDGYHSVHDNCPRADKIIL